MNADTTRRNPSASIRVHLLYPRLFLAVASGPSFFGCGSKPRCDLLFDFLFLWLRLPTAP